VVSSRCRENGSDVKGAEPVNVGSLGWGIRRDVNMRETYVLSIVQRGERGQKEASRRAFGYLSHSLVLDCGITESTI